MREKKGVIEKKRERSKKKEKERKLEYSGAFGDEREATLVGNETGIAIGEAAGDETDGQGRKK